MKFTKFVYTLETMEQSISLCNIDKINIEHTFYRYIYIFST